ncbi:MAG: GMC family oxidoreductase [Betaproteobacteria bacterium]
MIVVGSGAAGGWAAKELTESGLSVLVLEAGPPIRVEQDFPLPAPNEGRLSARLVHGITHQPIQMRCPAFNARTRRFFVDDREHPYTTPADKAYNWFRGRQVGGRMHTWGRVVARLSELELRAASRDGHGNDWPLAYDDLARAYDTVESFLGVSGCVDEVPSRAGTVVGGPSAMTRGETAFKAKVEAAFPGRRVIAARVARRDRDRTPSTLRAAQQTGRMTLRGDALVRSIRTDPVSGRATGVACIDRTTKQAFIASAKAVVLCASTVESVRILLNSACPRHPGGLGNAAGKLGLGITDHLLVGVGGPAPAARGETDAPASTDPYDFGTATGIYIPRFRNVEESHPGFLRGYAIQGGIGRGPSWYLMAHGEMLSRPENRVVIDRARRDAWGIPAARIELAWSANEHAMIADALAVLRAMAHAAGLAIRNPPSGRPLETLTYRLWKNRLMAQSGAFLPGSAMHELGGAAMGSDAATSVVDRWGRCWSAPNVIVADGACFPSGCSQNVTLTILALTVRACERLVDDYRSGSL